MDECARIKGLYSVLKHVPSRLHKCANWMGDCVSRRVALKVVDDVSLDYDSWVLREKERVESLYASPMTSRERSSKAMQEGIKGISFFGDNVGKVDISIQVAFWLSIVYQRYVVVKEN